MADLHFLVSRTDLRQTRLFQDSEPSSPLPDGAVRLRVDQFALTSNNVTYGAFGEAMHYWDFFPSPLPGYGRIPVWGFADVVESRAEGIVVGERFYGYLPMSTSLVVFPQRVSPRGFTDGAPHRADLNGVYNQYLRCSADPGYHPDQEALIALLRPLFVTSFLIDDFLADNGFFGAHQVVLSSASSKTAYGTAFCLALRRGSSSCAAVVGLTSAQNLAYTQDLGCYDTVVTYPQIATLPADTPSVYVDMSGSASLRAAVHGHWAEQLRHSCAVGGTHWNDLGGGKGLPGPRPQLFFAPAQIQKRHADWGGDVLQQRIAATWDQFVRAVSNPQSPWLTVVYGRGGADVQRVYTALLDGSVPANEGQMLSLEGL
jgi:hypothetical protein